VLARSAAQVSRRVFHPTLYLTAASHARPTFWPIRHGRSFGGAGQTQCRLVYGSGIGAAEHGGPLSRAKPSDKASFAEAYS